MDRQYAFEAIEGEREYQETKWPNSKNLPVTGEIILIEHYLKEFKQHYKEEDDIDDIGVPNVCLHDIRKIAALAVRAMENGGIKYRGYRPQPIPDELPDDVDELPDNVT